MHVQATLAITHPCQVLPDWGGELWPNLATLIPYTSSHKCISVVLIILDSMSHIKRAEGVLKSEAMSWNHLNHCMTENPFESCIGAYVGYLYDLFYWTISMHDACKSLTHAFDALAIVSRLFKTSDVYACMSPSRANTVCCFTAFLPPNKEVFTCQGLNGYRKPFEVCLCYWFCRTTSEKLSFQFYCLSRRWDHRTSLHPWQPRWKVGPSRGSYGL